MTHHYNDSTFDRNSTDAWGHPIIFPEHVRGDLVAEARYARARVAADLREVLALTSGNANARKAAKHTYRWGSLVPAKPSVSLYQRELMAVLEWVAEPIPDHLWCGESDALGDAKSYAMREQVPALTAAIVDCYREGLY